MGKTGDMNIALDKESSYWKSQVREYECAKIEALGLGVEV